MLSAYVMPPSGIPTPSIALKVLRSKGKSQKEAAILAGVPEPRVSAMLAGLAPLDLNVVMCWDLAVVSKIFRKLLDAKMAQQYEGVCLQDEEKTA